MKCKDCVHYKLCRDLFCQVDVLTDDDKKCDYYEQKRPHGECNQCRYYDGVHGVQGHAPCWHWNIGGVMWNDYCSRFEKEGGENE